jgi:two-component system response regulator YesN
MMPKVLIVDDETIFRKGLSRMITSIGEEWTVVGEAKDGYEALDKIDQFHPDFVLTDIRMPGMDGLQLQKIMKERFPGIHCIVLSGYDDFVYAKESIRYGAKDYLTKPVVREELTKTLERLKIDLIKQNATQRMEQATQQMKQHVSQNILTNLLRGNVARQELDLLSQIGIQTENACVCCFIVKLDRESVDEERYQRANPSLFQLYIQQLTQEIIDAHTSGYAFVLSDTEVVAFLSVREEPDKSDKQISNIAEQIRRRAKSLSNVTVTIGIGSPVKGLPLLHKSFKDAEISLLYRLVLGGDRILDYKTTAARNRLKEEQHDTLWKTLDQSIHEGRANDTEFEARQLITHLCQTLAQPEAVYQQICKIILQYYELAIKLDLVKCWLDDKDIRTLLLEICSITSRQELVDICVSVFGQLSRCISERDVKHRTGPVEQALEIMEQQYQQSLTLNMVADRVFLNPTYFSSLFKIKTGKSFIEMLTNIRIEAAKRMLLHTDKKIQAIADDAGFLNIRHFNRVFKEAVRKTPKSYREHFRQSQK